MIKKILLPFLAINSYSQAHTIQWQKSIGGSSNDIGLDVKPTTEPIETILIWDIDGKTMSIPFVNENSIAVQNLALGLYSVQIVAGGKTYQTKFTKE